MREKQREQGENRVGDERPERQDIVYAPPAAGAASAFRAERQANLPRLALNRKKARP